MSSHKKSVREQVKSGFLHVGEIVGGMLACAVALHGFLKLFSGAQSHHFRAPLTAWAEIGLATIIIFATAERWGGYVPGFLFLYDASKGFSYALFPPTTSSNFFSLTRMQWLGFGVYFAAAIALLWRFVPPRRSQATILDRATLTVFALSFLIAPALPTSFLLRIPIVGLAALLLAWIVYRYEVKKSKQRKHPQLDTPGHSLNPPQAVEPSEGSRS